VDKKLVLESEERALDSDCRNTQPRKWHDGGVEEGAVITLALPVG
jgi:hypothetical protein